MKNGILIGLFLAFVACTTQNIRQERTEGLENLPAASSTTPEQPVSIKKTSSSMPDTPKDTMLGSPLGSAVQSMKKAEQEMSETVKLVAQLKAGDQVLDCRNNRLETFKTLRTFFGSPCFAYDEYNFWFLGANGKKISVYEEDGILQSCTIGMFASFKRLIAIQFNGPEKVQTEFYVDSTKGELMVHRYHGSKRIHENYRLAGY